jgi:ATP-binding cassette, subfamily B, bacterial PglK
MARTDLTGSPASMLRFLWRLLDTRRRWQSVGLQLVSLVMGITTLGGVAAIVPFFAVLSDRSLITRNPVFARLHELLAFHSDTAFLSFLGICFVVTVLVASVSNFLGILAINRFSYGVGADLRVSLFDEYLHRDSAFHARTHSSVLINNIVNEVGRVATGVVQSMLMLVSSLVTCTLITGSLLIFSPSIALVAAALLGGTHLAFYALLRARLTRNGTRELELAQQRTRTLVESFGAIREVLVAGRQGFFTTRFAEQCHELAHVVVNTQALSTAPRFIAETAVAATLIGAALWLTLVQGTSDWAATLSFLALAAYRLLPSLHQAFTALAKLRLDGVAFQRVAADLDRQCQLGVPRSSAPLIARWSGRPRKSIELREATVRYEGRDRPALDRVSLRILSGTMVGVTGPNGSGKSTLLDLLVGLRTPDTGVIEVDGEALDERSRASWQATIAYLPQHVLLLDATVSENIALDAHNAVDLERLREAAALSGVDTLTDSLPGGYEHVLGERGVQLSGGQRQRIGLARALYRRPSLLVLDEPTAALDRTTELEVMEMLATLRGRCTIVVVTHREESLRYFDLVVTLAQGRQIARDPLTSGAVA